MILQFPDLDTLRLALTSGTVPPAVSLAPVAGGPDDRGQVWLQPAVAPPRAALAELRRLGVQTPRTSPVPMREQLHSWLQVFPVEPEAGRPLPPEQAPVLFDLAAGQFSTVATEMLRLGNDRQGFRYLEGKHGERVLLRVVGPPYYTLLRALDPDGPDAPVAFVECAPRAWIQLGHTHPFARQIKVPEGKLLLLRPPQQWTLLDDAPFREIYEVLEFVLPSARSEWREGEAERKLRVPLRLVPGDPGDADELWVLRDRPLEQLDELVNNAADDLVQKLSFAVAERAGKTVMVLRARPSKGPPPAPVLDAVRFRSYQKLPNLFVPSGKRLHPPLSRHVLRRLLADDPAVITWLYPHDDGTFTPETLPDEAFRPLSDWIDYVLDHDREALQTWVQAAQFDFEPFVCDDAEPPKPKRPPAGRDKKGGRQPSEARGGKDDGPADAGGVEGTADLAFVVEAVADLPRAEPSELERRLKALEDQFLAVEGPLDSPRRLALWPEMAKLNEALQRGEDAGTCWLNAFWTNDTVAPALAWHWFRAEAGRVPALDGYSWAAKAQAAPKPREIDAADLDRALGLEEPTSADVRTLAAYVFWAGARKPAPAALVQRLPRLRHFFEQFEQRLPVRAAWLVGLSLTRLSGDVLGLARTRDRLLERLYQTGLRPEQDLAPFLQASGQPSGDRHRAFRTWLVGLGDAAQEWLKRLPVEFNEGNAQTAPYVDLMFAFGLARLGETEASQRLVQRATAALANRDEVHAALLSGFTYQVSQALAGKPHERLPQPRRDEYEKLPEMSRYLVKRMLQHSSILDPSRDYDALKDYRPGTPLEKALTELSRASDREEVVAGFEGLWREHEGSPEAKGKREALALILMRALKRAPGLGEQFAVSWLLRAGPVLDTLPRPDDTEATRAHAELIEKALFAAAHFDRLDQVQNLVGRFHKLLDSQAGHPGVTQAIREVAGQSFRSLRKLGLRDEIDRLLRKMHDLVLASQQAPSLAALLKQGLPDEGGKAANFDAWVAALMALAPLAGGWYYFGRDAEAEPVLEAVRGVLFQGRLLALNRKQDQTRLACDYLTAVGQAPVPEVQRRLEEFFRRAEVRDGWTTASHFALLKLRVIEAAVNAVVSDEGSTGGETRRWLDEDEFFVRRRIHRDLRDAVAHSEK